MHVQATQPIGIVVLILSASCFSAPVLKNILSDKSPHLERQANNAKQINEQERELESLAQSLQSSNSVGDNVKIEEHHHVSYENINGKEKEVHETEKAVLDADTGKVVSDIKQEVTETEGANGVPETHVETKIDVPSKGIHETFSNDGEETLSNYDVDIIDNDGLPNFGVDDADTEESIITPESLAEYLWETQDFGKFRGALQEIVASRIMTPEEAQAFYQDVVVAYDKLRQANSLYPFQSEDEKTFLSPLFQRPQYSNVIPGLPAAEVNFPFGGLSGQKRLPPMPVYAEEYPGLSDYDLDQQRQAYELNTAIQREETVDEMLVSLLEQWYTSAIESGDVDGAKLVSDLATYVASQPESSRYDDDQVKDVLAELFASLANDESMENADNYMESLPENQDEQPSSYSAHVIKDVEEEKPVEEETAPVTETESDPESSGEEDISKEAVKAKSA